MIFNKHVDVLVSIAFSASVHLAFNDNDQINKYAKF